MGGAIAFGRMEYKGRSKGGSATRSAAYNECDQILDARTGDVHDYRHKEHSGHQRLGVLLPEGAPPALENPRVLWNAAEAAEKRKDAQVAREVILALPRGGSPEDWRILTIGFVKKHIVSKGCAAQVDIHTDSAGNPHAHILITCRKVTAQGFYRLKDHDLDPSVTATRKGGLKVDGIRWSEIWGQHQDQYFSERGMDVRCAPHRQTKEPHLGPTRFAARAGSRAAMQEAREAETEAWLDPAKVRETMLARQPSFRVRDLDRALAKNVTNAAERSHIKAAVLAASVLLYDRTTGRSIGRYTSEAIIKQERAVVTNGRAMAASGGHGAKVAAIGQTLASLGRADQRAAFHSAVGGAALALIEGRAGTGKTYLLGKIAQCYTESHTVVGLGPTNVVARDLRGLEGVSRADTLAAELWRLDHGKESWNSKTVVLLDEAGMADTDSVSRVLEHARRSGAKLIAVGDTRQLQAVGRGGAFASLVKDLGSTDLTSVVRQREDWQRRAAEDFGAGRVREALTAFESHGRLQWGETRKDALAALLLDYRTDLEKRPEADRFVLCRTNTDVHLVNQEIRAIRVGRFEIGVDQVLKSEGKEKQFAVGDRVQFTESLKKDGIYNADTGKIVEIDDHIMFLKMDNGKDLKIDTEKFDGFRLGYAGTVHKAQGQSITETYKYRMGGAEDTYVGLTRQKDDCKVYLAREDVADLEDLIRQSSRVDDRQPATTYCLAEEAAIIRSIRERTGEAAVVDAIYNGKQTWSEIKAPREIGDKLSNYLSARVEAGELWEQIRDYGREHPEYPAFVTAQERRNSCAIACASDQEVVKVLREKKIVPSIEFASDHLMATGTRTRGEAVAKAWGHALELGVREPTPLELLPALADAYKQAEAAGSSLRYELYRDLLATLAKIDAGDLGQAPRHVQDLVQRLHDDRAAEQEQQSHGMSL